MVVGIWKNPKYISVTVDSLNQTAQDGLHWDLNRPDLIQLPNKGSHEMQREYIGKDAIGMK